MPDGPPSESDARDGTSFAARLLARARRGAPRSPRTTVLWATCVLMLLWVVLHIGLLTRTQNGGIRFFLTVLFALAILLRRKPRPASSPGAETGDGGAPPRRRPWGALPTAPAGVGGALLMILGLMFHVRQAEWLGLLILCFAGLQWSLPARFGRDLPLSFCLLYWAHPLPSQVFGPFQLAMQRMSVRGSEWLLHLFDVRVWAEGMVLRTEQTVCEVPEWCSGMRTATTVFLLSLGLAILRRLRWRGCAAFVAAAVVQALLLNIVRISAVVTLTPRFARLTTAEFLHNTMDTIVIAAAFLVYVELALLERRRGRKAVRAAEPHYAHDLLITSQPPFWKAVGRHRGSTAAALALLLLTAALAYKGRPVHRMRMIGDLAEALAHHERYEEAERAVDLVGAFWPDDDEWKLLRVRILVARRKYEEVLAALDTLPVRDSAGAVQIDVLRAYSLMGLDRLDEAAAIVNRLPPDVRQSDPRAGMILAEMAFHADDPDGVARHVVTAAQWRPNTPRIRMLYPYLRTYRKWDAIAKSDTKQPFAEPVQALSAAEAYMNVNEEPMVASMAIQAMKDWPADPRVLEPLFFLAVKHNRPQWERLFATHLRQCVAEMNDPETIYPLFERCIRLHRPDLAWFLCRHIEERSPEHPVLPLVLARYGNRWFLFRRRFLGFPAGRAADTIDISDILGAGRAFAPWQEPVDSIPYGRALLTGEPLSARKEHLREAVAGFAALAARSRLSVPMHYEYVWALNVAAGVEAAREEIQRLVANYPGETDNARLRLSEMYEDAADWENVYETLRGYLSSRTPQLASVLRLCRAQRALRMGLGALHTAREAVRLFPDSTLAATLLADTLMEHDAAEDALTVLTRPRRWHERSVDILTVRVLRETQRFVAADALRRGAMLPRTAAERLEEQRMFLPPAELSTLWHRVSLPSAPEFEENAAIVRRNLATAKSPFFQRLLARWLESYTAGCSGTQSELEWWAACGRDDLERAVSLNQYTLLLCRQQAFDAARTAAAEAVTRLPQSPILWRILIGLSNDDHDTIRRARAACPDDSELWLADLVTRARPRRDAERTDASADEVGPSVAGLSEKDAMALIEEATAASPAVISAAALVRAGDYLFRIGQPRAAAVAARAASDRARTLLPAHVLAVKCALIEKDKEWALQATKRAIESALDPPLLFFRKLVELRTDGRQIPLDPEFIEALRNLRRKEPDNPLWAEMLGYVRFQRGGWEIVDALSEMTDAIGKGVRSKSAFMIAAECARLLENYDRAAELLRQGISLFPDDLALRNNLAFVLAHLPEGVEEAATLAERLASEAPDDPDIMDTLAVIYLRSDRLPLATDIVNGILDRTEEGSTPWFRARTHLADIALRMSRPERAIEILSALLRSAEGIPDADLMKANDLFIQARLGGSERRAAAETNVPPASADGQTQ